MRRKAWLVGVLPAVLAAQQSPELQQVLERLERLERENRALTGEVRSLRRELDALRAPAAAPAARSVEERLAVQERRTEEMAQTKVEASAKFPISLTGMALFNAFWNGRYGGDAQYPVVAQAEAGRANAGGSPRQTVLGLRFQGPEVAGGRVNGSVYMDLFAGSASSLNHLLRLRVAALGIDWESTSILVGQEKPIISPREPESLAQIGLSPLTAAGNLWLWQPQARVEQRFRFGDEAGLRAQVGVYQTSETVGSSEYPAATAPARPGLQGRFEFWKGTGARRVEFAPGFHISTSHVLGGSVPSRIVSADWLVRPAGWFDFSGMLFRGSNVSVLGALRQGIRVEAGVPRPVHAWGGWAQAAFRPTSRLSFHAFAGQQDDRNRELRTGAIGKNLAYGANVMYRLGPNVLAALEAASVRTTFLGLGTRSVPHYDLALAYLF